MKTETRTISYTQAKLVAIDETQTDWHYLRDCASFLLSRYRASNEDIADAESLAKRAVAMQCAELGGQRQ